MINLLDFNKITNGMSKYRRLGKHIKLLFGLGNSEKETEMAPKLWGYSTRTSELPKATKCKSASSTYIIIIIFKSEVVILPEK